MKYRVSANLTISTWTVLEADSPKQAIESAKERSVMQLPFNLGGDEEDEFIIEELDSEPEIDTFRVEEVE